MPINLDLAVQGINLSGLKPSLDYPYLIFLIIPIFIILLILISKNFIKDAVTSRGLKIFVIISRTLIFLFLLIAIASPFLQRETSVKGDPYVKILVDNSTSFTVFDPAYGEKLKTELEKSIGVEVRYVGFGDKSALGDGILNNMESDESILLITDGNNNEGSDLGDVALHAAKLNTTINVLNIKPTQKDSSIKIIGPSKVTEEVENIFLAKISSTNEDLRHVIITLDDSVIYDEYTKEKEIRFTKTFDSGYHKIKAVLDQQDYFIENNEFYKVVKVVPKPKIILYTLRESPLQALLQQLYDVAALNSLEGINLENYLGLIINNIPAGQLDKDFSKISEFVSNNNGLVVFGGSSSYDKGSYKDSLIETILPVFVSTTGKQEGDVNVVIVIDVSGSTRQQAGSSVAVDVEKALALSIIDSISLDNRIGIVAFEKEAHTVEILERLSEKNIEEMKSKVKTLTYGGSTLISSGIVRAVKLLDPVSGSKNIILISDGRTQSKQTARNSVSSALNKGIKVYTVGVGKRTDEDFMKELAQLGNGIYFKAEDNARFKVLFGEPEEKKTDKFGLVILDKNHFITNELEISATILGFNQVVPKSTSSLLITTDSGDTLVSAWRSGLGRVVSMATDDGTEQANELLTKKGSVLISRIVNWAIGDPDRKNKNYIDIQDTRVNESAEVKYKGDSQPVAQGLVFYKVDENTYSASITMQETGFKNLLGASFAVNYRSEFDNIGFNDDLYAVAEVASGNVFEQNDYASIIDAVRSQSKRSINKKIYYRWPFITLILIIFLIEIFIRKLFHYRLTRNK